MIWYNVISVIIYTRGLCPVIWEVHVLNKNLQRLAEPGSKMYLFFLVVFAAAALLFKMYELAAAEAVVILLLLVYTAISRRRRAKQLAAYIESLTYETENAKSNTLMNFPLPIAVFRLDDSRIVWGNEMFFSMCGATGARLDACMVDLIPEFSAKWLMEGFLKDYKEKK